jgi:hypothetical protein
MSTWETDWAAGWTAAVWATEDWSAGCSAGSEQTTWGGGCGSWEQSGQQQSGLQSRSPDRSPYSREPGNGNRPKANDPKGWSRGENRPTEFEYNAMLKFGPDGVTKKVGNQFKTYLYKETKDMGAEDRMSRLFNALQRQEEAKIKMEAAHEEDLEYHSAAMERAHNVLMDEAMKKRGTLVRTVEVEVEVLKEVVVEVVKEVHVVQKVEVVKKVFVEVDVLPKGEPRPEPLFRGGQSVHQWWATWMSGAYETPAGIKGKHGRPAWYSASVYS